MPKRMSDDEAMEMAYKKLFGDMDGIESHTLFDGSGEDALEGTAANAMPESKDSGGMKITIEPIMKGGVEGERDTDTRRDGDNEDEDDEDDKLKGIGGMSPLMSQLHGSR